jgi:hypothetical protein
VVDLTPWRRNTTRNAGGPQPTERFTECSPLPSCPQGTALHLVGSTGQWCHAVEAVAERKRTAQEPLVRLDLTGAFWYLIRR